MGDSITSLPGISDKGMATITFHRAGLPTVNSIRNGDLCERKVDGALKAMRLEPEYAHLSASYWRALGRRCTTTLFNVRGMHGDPFPPDEFCCGISNDWLSDAVITPHGLSFSRREIEDWLVENSVCPFTRQPLTHGDFIPKKKLQEAVHYFRCNHKRLFAALRG
jgi:hypothetical protein